MVFSFYAGVGQTSNAACLKMSNNSYLCTERRVNELYFMSNGNNYRTFM